MKADDDFKLIDRMMDGFFDTFTAMGNIKWPDTFDDTDKLEFFDDIISHYMTRESYDKCTILQNMKESCREKR